MMKKVLPLLISILLLSCSKNESLSGDHYNLGTDKSRIIGINECLDIAEEGVEICVAAVKDSRCPSGGECIWEGDAVVKFQWRSNEDNKIFELHTNEKFQRDTVIDHLKIKLLKVSPYPQLNEPISSNAYRIEVAISAQ